MVPLANFTYRQPRICVGITAQLAAVGLLLLGLIGLQKLSAAEETEAVQSAQQALQEGGTRYPWYDAETDQPRPLKVTPYQPDEDPNRHSNWEWGPNSKSSSTATTTTTTGGSGFSLFDLPFFDMIGLTVLALLIVGLCVYLAWAFFKDDDEEEQTSLPSFKPRAGEVDRVSELPMQLGNVKGDFLEAARREYQAGNYSQAIVYLFSHELLQLDRQQVIRLTKGKTNRQYLKEVRSRPELRSLFETTMVAFEDVFFGKHALDRDRFEACWKHVDDFHRLLEGVAT